MMFFLAYIWEKVLHILNSGLKEESSLESRRCSNKFKFSSQEFGIKRYGQINQHNENTRNVWNQISQYSTQNNIKS